MQDKRCFFAFQIISQLPECTRKHSRAHIPACSETINGSFCLNLPSHLRRTVVAKNKTKQKSFSHFQTLTVRFHWLPQSWLRSWSLLPLQGNIMTLAREKSQQVTSSFYLFSECFSPTTPNSYGCHHKTGVLKVLQATFAAEAFWHCFSRESLCAQLRNVVNKQGSVRGAGRVVNIGEWCPPTK